MPEHQGWIPDAPDSTKQLISTTDTTVEEMRSFIKRLKKHYPDFCNDCQSLLKEAIA